MKQRSLRAVAGLTAVGVITLPLASLLSREATSIIYLDQGWSAERRSEFYYTPQGSRLIPYSWMLALEEPDSERLFLDPSHLERLGYITEGAPSALNPDGLPIGFVKEPSQASERPWLGLTCAACHTGEVTLKGKRIRVDGGPSLADFQAFTTRLGQALDATLADPGKFERFAGRLKTTDLRTLRPELEAFAAGYRKLLAGNWTPEPYGHARLDAFGHILNAVAADALGEPANTRIPNAPVSYPFLWTTPQQRYVQWNGIAVNPIGRNTGEVLGVFGQVALSGLERERFRSSVLTANLHALEKWIAELKAPVWPESQLGQINTEKHARGRELFIEHCQNCHGGVPYRFTAAEDNIVGRRLIDVRMVDQKKIGTDPTMLQNFYGRRARTGSLAPNLGGVDEQHAGSVLGLVIQGVVKRDLDERGLSVAIQAEYAGFRFKSDGTPEDPWQGPPAYKAGPLAGIWATAPYLHNGSVPTLYDLLSPEAERPAVFWVGSRELDPLKVGFVSSATELSEADRARLFRFDTTRPGNSNKGHVFPDPSQARLDHEDREALIEFIKTLEDPTAPAPYRVLDAPTQGTRP